MYEKNENCAIIVSYIEMLKYYILFAFIHSNKFRGKLCFKDKYGKIYNDILKVIFNFIFKDFKTF